MIPLLLISNDPKVTKKYLKKYIDNGAFFFEISPENKEYSIKEIRDLIQQTNSFHKDIRVYFLNNFHLSSLEAQNAFLKLLEEPPKNTLFILSAESENKLIPTIISRVKIIHLNKKTPMPLTPNEKSQLNKLLTSKNLSFFTETSTNLDKIILFFQEKLRDDKKAAIIIKESLKLKNLLENNNLNPQLVLDHILIFIRKQYTMKL